MCKWEKANVQKVSSRWPQCPAKRCSKRPETTEHVSTANDSIEPNYILGNAISVTTESFITYKHIDCFPYEALEDINENVTLCNPDADQIQQPYHNVNRYPTLDFMN